MNSELSQSMPEREDGMGKTSQKITGGHTREAVRERILYLQKISRDPYFNQYMERMLHDMERHIASPAQVAAELDRSYAVYQKRMYYNLVAVPGRQPQSQFQGQQYGQPQRQYQGQPYSQPQRQYQGQPYSQPQRQFTGQPYGQPQRQFQGQLQNHSMYQQHKEPERLPAENIGKNTAVEFFVGAGMLSIIGALFLVVAFIIFGLNFLEGPIQGIILYAISAVFVLLSELLLRRKLPRFATAISGMGIVALYVTSIISYRHLEMINSLAAVIITLAVAMLSLLLGSKKDSAAYGLVGIGGSYICFLMIGSMNADSWFLAAMVGIFLINFTGLSLPGYRKKVAANLFHLSLNTLLTVILAVGAAINGVETVYIIFGITLNIALLNLYICKQDKSAVQVVIYGIEMGILGFMTLLFAASMTMLEPDSMRIYVRFITIILTMAAGGFFCLINHDKKIRIALMYYSLLLSLFLSVADPDGFMDLYMVLLFFLVGRLFLRRKEWEVLNCILTVSAFITGLAYGDLPQSWLYFGAFLLSLLFVRRWHLFYRCSFTLFLILFVTIAIPANNVRVPVCAAILFGLIPAFHLVTAIKDKKAMKAGSENQANAYYTVSSVWIGRIYLIINLSVLGIVSLYSIYCRNYLPVIITALIGAAAILCFLSSRFNSYFKRKYLLMAVYLTLMSFISRVGIPIYVSIFLAAVAIFCIAAGFMIRDRALRIYGLLLALFVCAKVAVFDFREFGVRQRIILFLVIGVIMLFTSLIYIILEKRSSRKKLSGDGGQKAVSAPVYQVNRDAVSYPEWSEEAAWKLAEAPVMAEIAATSDEAEMEVTPAEAEEFKAELAGTPSETEEKTAESNEALSAATDIPSYEELNDHENGDENVGIEKDSNESEEEYDRTAEDE